MDFDGEVVRVTEYNEPPSSDGLLENQMIFEGFEAVEVLNHVMGLVSRFNQHDDSLRLYHQVMVAIRVKEKFGRN